MQCSSIQPAPAAAAPTIAVVLKGYPRLSETFIAQELHALEQRGLRLLFVSLRRPTDRHSHPVHREINAAVNYLPEYLHQQPLRVLRAWWRARRAPGYRLALRCFLRDLWRDRSRNRIRRFGQAAVLWHELPPSVGWIYAHFLHTPASVAHYASLLSGLPWSCSAHAKDVWTSPGWEIAQKLAHCQWLVTCTRANHEFLAAQASRPGQVHLLYHGLDFSRFPDPGERAPGADGSRADQPVRLLTVGRAVPKKGLDDLLRALAELEPDLAFCWHHVGGGELLGELRALAQRLGLAHRIRWHGALAQEDVLALYREAEMFVLPSRIAADGDRDGLPNVLMEALSQRLACVSTTVSGIPELLQDGHTGVLVAPGDSRALAAALARLIGDPAARKRLGEVGCAHVHANFSSDRGVAQLAALLPP